MEDIFALPADRRCEACGTEEEGKDYYVLDSDNKMYCVNCIVKGDRGYSEPRR